MEDESSSLDSEPPRGANATPSETGLAEPVPPLEDIQRVAEFGHELRTPLTAMRGYADLLLEEYRSHEAFTALTAIKRNANHLLALINDQLDLSKASAGQLSTESIPVDPRQIVRDVLDTLRICVGEKPLQLRSTIDESIPQSVYTDPMRLRQILNNLVSNAVKFTARGTVQIGLSAITDNSRHFLKFTVTDSGIGLSPEELQRLFRPFAQANTSTARRYGGTGLGLVISRELARLLGGDLTLSSEPGKGTTATAIIHAEPVVEEEQTPVESRRPEQIDLTGRRILIVEDSEDNSRLIGHFLRKAGAEFEIAENGEAACQMALAAETSASPFDAVLMDLDLPVLDGCSATARLVQAGYPRPIVMLTAHSEAYVGKRCRDAGAVAMASKPLEPRKLLETISELLLNGPPGDESRDLEDSHFDAIR